MQQYESVCEAHDEAQLDECEAQLEEYSRHSNVVEALGGSGRWRGRRGLSVGGRGGGGWVRSIKKLHLYRAITTVPYASSSLLLSLHVFPVVSIISLADLYMVRVVTVCPCVSGADVTVLCPMCKKDYILLCGDVFLCKCGLRLDTEVRSCHQTHT
jgi:hypothetical protein